MANVHFKQKPWAAEMLVANASAEVFNFNDLKQHFE